MTGDCSLPKIIQLVYFWFQIPHSFHYASYPDIKWEDSYYQTKLRSLQPDTALWWKKMQGLLQGIKQGEQAVNAQETQTPWWLLRKGLFCFVCFPFFSFLATLQHMEFPGQGSSPSHSCGWSQILNPLCQARYRTWVPLLPRPCWSCCATAGAPGRVFEGKVSERVNGYVISSYTSLWLVDGEVTGILEINIILLLVPPGPGSVF